jgi:predicted amidohydrolase YtcJ
VTEPPRWKGPPQWTGTRRVLFTGGTILTRGVRIPAVNGSVGSEPEQSAMLVDGDLIAWIGSDADAQRHISSADEHVNLAGAVITPGFVDAHVHATSTGLTLAGLDLTRANSLTEALSLIEAAARSARGAPILGHGWDETRWPEGRPPTSSEVDRATWGSLVYLSRIDVHSAVISGALLAEVPRARELDGYGADGLVSRAAHHAYREVALRLIGAAQQERAHRETRIRAASLGIVAIHEMAGPAISSADDLRGLMRLSDEEPGPLVSGYWGELAEAGGVERAVELGAIGAAGDLFIDGAIGSRTACLRHSYLDSDDSSGAQYLSEEQVRDHVIACIGAGLQAGFHVIGDRATDVIMSAMSAAALTLGSDAIRAGGHRLEHAEMLDSDHIAEMARLGMTASVQPMFDGHWGAAGGMYEQRLGRERSLGMNRFADLAAAGVLTAFGSDSPVTDLGPWQAIAAAVHHHQPAQRMSPVAAFWAHSVAGWRAVGDLESGVLAPGAPAHYVIWDTAASAHSSAPLPAALRTVVSGATVHDLGVVGAR